MIFNRDQLSRVVCNIRTPIATENRLNEKVGTGIFISKGNEAWILTAAHVAKETNDSSYIIFCNGNIPVKREIKEFLANSQCWEYHPIADMAILKINVSKNIDILQNRCLPFENLALSKDQIPTRDVELTTIGFPRGLGAEGRFSPFTFRSYATSNLITLPRADIGTLCDFFCLENPSVGGYSGGPVFDLGIMIVGCMTSTKENTLLHGIISGTIYDDTGGKIATVTPLFYLSDLINF